MKKEFLANRKPELELFREMLAGKATERILILLAPSSKGKSILIRHLRRECSPDFCVVHIDFKGGGFGLARLWLEFQASRGAEAFPHFAAQFQSLHTPLSSTTITDNRAGANLNINVAPVIEVENPQTRADNIARLSAAFFQDLQTLCARLVVIFDTFEQAPSEAKEWISGTFLPFVPRLAGLCVVIAGQSVPEETSAPWEDISARRTLGNIDDVDEWHTYARAAALPHPPDAIKQTVIYCKGDPDAIVGMLLNTAAEWRR